jgi:hypothetical protein
MRSNTRQYSRNDKRTYLWHTYDTGMVTTNVFVCACVWVCVCVCVCVCESVREREPLFPRAWPLSCAWIQNCACLCSYVYVSVYMCACLCLSLFLRMGVNLYVRRSARVSRYMCSCVCIFRRQFLWSCVCVCVCVCVCLAAERRRWGLVLHSALSLGECELSEGSSRSCMSHFSTARGGAKV